MARRLCRGEAAGAIKFIKAATPYFGGSGRLLTPFRRVLQLLVVAQSNNKQKRVRPPQSNTFYTTNRTVPVFLSSAYSSSEGTFFEYEERSIGKGDAAKNAVAISNSDVIVLIRQQ